VDVHSYLLDSILIRYIGVHAESQGFSEERMQKFEGIYPKPECLLCSVIQTVHVFCSHVNGAEAGPPVIVIVVERERGGGGGGDLRHPPRAEQMPDPKEQRRLRPQLQCQLRVRQVQVPSEVARAAAPPLYAHGSSSDTRQIEAATK
jgi:hypothetical protein